MMLTSKKEPTCKVWSPMVVMVGGLLGAVISSSHPVRAKSPARRASRIGFAESERKTKSGMIYRFKENWSRVILFIGHLSPCLDTGRV